MKKKCKQRANKQLVPIVRNYEIRVIPNKELTSEENIKELEDLSRSLEVIRKTYYSNHASIERVQERKFWDIVRARFLKLRTEKKW